ncbi:PH domain-containing protein [Chryseolinea soli]|uniref:Uncharacterized protein YyaB-like PH domain-containing protein n=1 Tax=Chryseolinea soli TaxID=2321403 RepID=A0A385SG50_9BACT|nr:PH domain-containing protein [Chryseolinea soli]AYB29386.1 hypothetical protein D4L85_01755 [Chryseolinea soli]
MRKTYQSKVGLILCAAIALPILLPLIITPFDPNGLIVGLILASVIALPFLFGTHYRIQGHVLEIRCAFIIRIDVDILRITRVSKTRNPISAPALSLDRMEIIYGNGLRHVIISPKDKMGFVHSLKAINDRITVSGVSDQASSIL